MVYSALCFNLKESLSNTENVFLGQANSENFGGCFYNPAVHGGQEHGIEVEVVRLYQTVDVFWENQRIC